MQDPASTSATTPQSTPAAEPTPSVVTTAAEAPAPTAKTKAGKAIKNSKPKTSKPAPVAEQVTPEATPAAPTEPKPVRTKASTKPATKTAPKASAKKAAPVKVTAPKSKVKPSKLPQLKVKMVRDSFTMPSDDFELINQIKQRALEHKLAVKKSEVLRAALHSLVTLPDAKLLSTLKALAPIKKGRPKKA